MSDKILKRIYMDHAASTPLDPRIRIAMEPYLEEEFGNPSALYREGRRAREALENARESVAGVLGAATDEIIFTSGGTEGDVLALMGVAHAYSNRGKHIISTTIEHHAVLNTLDALKKEGFEITLVEVGQNGIVDPQKIEEALRLDTILVSVIYANNEIGTIQPITEIARRIKKFRDAKVDKMSGPFFHTDACQAAGYLDLNVKNLGIDLMVMNGSKIYGPKGVGALYVRKGVRIQPIFLGGAQEGKRRAGTENIPGIIGFAEALKIANDERTIEGARVKNLRDKLIDGILKTIPRTVLNGDREIRLPNNINISILDIEGEGVILYLDSHGIACSTGSACTSESLDPSHVILALGRPYEYAHASIRFTLGRSTTESDIEHVLKVLPYVTETLRKISPIKIDVDATSMSHPEAFAGEGLRVKAKSKNFKKA
ncbi:MAG: cysteine desulfurase family protein [Patescibacteria group bacterium]